jgi:photosystem II stability/assembly factor-like uncharacterized protein
MLRSFHGAARIPRWRPAIIVILALAATIAPGRAIAQWVRVAAPQLTGVYLYDTEFRGLSDGYAIGAGTGGLFIYKTTDGGKGWKTMKGLGLSPSSFTFLDDMTGLAGGLIPKCKCMGISRTTDAGATWSVDTIRSAAGTIDSIRGFGVNAMAFTGSTGYGVGINGTIVKTPDRGDTWFRTNTGNTTDFVSDIWASTPDIAYAIAAPSIDSASYIFYRTSNGGATWERTYNFIDNAGFQEVHFITPEIGFVGGFTLESAVIYKTTDGGATWVRKFAEGPGGTIFGIEFEDMNVGYAVGANGMILRTTDGGETWTPESSGTTAVLPNISIVDGTAFVVGQFGTVLRREAGASGVGSSRPEPEEFDLARGMIERE